MAKRYYPLDARTLFGEDITLTASGVVKKNGKDVVFKIGKGRQELSLVLKIAAMAVAGNQRYTFALQGCNKEDFTGDIENLGIIELGHTSVRTGGAKTSPVADYAIRVSNDMAGEYEFVRLNLIAAGTGTTVTLTAYLSEPTA